MVSCISLSTVFARVEVNSETFDLWGVKAVWNKDDQTLNINGNGKVDKAKWEKLKETLSLREDVASAVRITFTDGARFPDDASSFFENVKGEIRFQSTIPLDTSNVVNMSFMFAGTKFNQDISSWNTSNVVNMSFMFYLAESFNQPLNNWDVSNVTNMHSMFHEAISFNQPLNNWNVSKVTDMNSMFRVAYNFNQPLNNWDVSNVTDMNGMFEGPSFFDQDISSWNPKSLEEAGHFIYGGAFSIENNDKLLKSWSKKLDSGLLTNLNIEVPYCESEEAVKMLEDKNYFTVGSFFKKDCNVETYSLTKWKSTNLPIIFEVDWYGDRNSEVANFPLSLGLEMTKEKTPRQ